MKGFARKVLSISLAAAVALVCLSGCSKGKADGAAALTVLLNDAQIATLRVSPENTSGGTDSSDGEQASVIDLAAGLASVTVDANDKNTVRLQFEREPDKLTVRYDTTLGLSQGVALINDSFDMEKKNGTYIYSVIATWPDGSQTTDIFRLQVGNQSDADILAEMNTEAKQAIYDQAVAQKESILPAVKAALDAYGKNQLAISGYNPVPKGTAIPKVDKSYQFDLSFDPASKVSPVWATIRIGTNPAYQMDLAISAPKAEGGGWTVTGAQFEDLTPNMIPAMAAEMHQYYEKYIEQLIHTQIFGRSFGPDHFDEFAKAPGRSGIVFMIFEDLAGPDVMNKYTSAPYSGAFPQDLVEGAIQKYFDISSEKIRELCDNYRPNSQSYYQKAPRQKADIFISVVAARQNDSNLELDYEWYDNDTGNVFVAGTMSINLDGNSFKYVSNNVTFTDY